MTQHNKIQKPRKATKLSEKDLKKISGGLGRTKYPTGSNNLL